MDAQGKAQELFRFMLDDPDWTPEGARRSLGFSQIDLELAQHSLLEAGLLHMTRGKSARPTAVEPAIAVARLLAMEEEGARQWMASVHERRSTLAALGSKMMRLQAQADTDTRVGLLTGQERIATALNGVSVTAQQEILSMHPGTPLPRTVLEGSMDRNRAALERGVTMRSLHLEAMNKVPRARAHLEALEDSGCQVRLTPALPFRLILVDGVLAYVSAPSAGSQVSALEIRGEEICWLLRQVFEHCWLHGRAIPKGESAVQEVDLSDRERAVLRMLAAGYTDASVARALGISTRTLRRMTTVILEKIGARSRFEAGVRAATLALVETSPGGPADR
ncbi:LuxR C-terminal-related transcriptional regulator [Streptomyces sp. NPDC047737]|jgi:DNA-binding CsgD family transcriptional regulator/ActR/RegA family two-component response regulator|uniref:helix-turn-helix transcriptional regulator n=1 Tax=unclassified Streptomyces TaxID=2593676 RepID=UPI0033F3D29D